MHILQIVDNRNGKNVIRDKCMESVKRFVSGKDSYTVREIPYNEDAAMMLTEIDKLCYTFAKDHDDLFYVNAYCFLAAFPTEEQIKEKKIIVGELETVNGPIISPILLFVNGNSAFFEANYEILIQKQPNNVFGLTPTQLQLFSEEAITYDRFSYSYMPLMNIEYTVNSQVKAFNSQVEDLEKEIVAYRSGIQNINNTVQLFDDLRKKVSDGRIRQ